MTFGIQYLALSCYFNIDNSYPHFHSAVFTCERCILFILDKMLYTFMVPYVERSDHPVDAHTESTATTLIKHDALLVSLSVCGPRHGAIVHMFITIHSSCCCQFNSLRLADSQHNYNKN